MFKSNSTDLLHKSDLQIKQDDKFFSMLLSKETNSSFRVYYGGASGAVPFVWESQPGTPKNKYCDTSLPPLTPPPSYQSNSMRDYSIKKPS
ncbi:Alkylated dna repair protein, partial [Thalictrum thalictroides]